MTAKVHEFDARVGEGYRISLFYPAATPDVEDDPLSDKAELMGKLQRVSLADSTRVMVLRALLGGMLEEDVKRE